MHEDEEQPEGSANKAQQLVERGIDAWIARSDSLCTEGKFQEAMVVLEKAYKLGQKKLGEDHPKTQLVLVKKNIAPKVLGRAAQARFAHRQS
jgi:hypothetical protein